MIRLPVSYMPAARRCRELAAKAPDGVLKILAKHLDLPMDDAETVSFLRCALREADKEIHTMELQDRINYLNSRNTEDEA